MAQRKFYDYKQEWFDWLQWHSIGDQKRPMEKNMVTNHIMRPKPSLANSESKKIHVNYFNEPISVINDTSK